MAGRLPADARTAAESPKPPLKRPLTMGEAGGGAGEGGATGGGGGAGGCAAGGVEVAAAAGEGVPGPLSIFQKLALSAWSGAGAAAGAGVAAAEGAEATDARDIPAGWECGNAAADAEAAAAACCLSNSTFSATSAKSFGSPRCTSG